jgi:hypothetical protein
LVGRVKRDEAPAEAEARRAAEFPTVTGSDGVQRRTTSTRAFEIPKRHSSARTAFARSVAAPHCRVVDQEVDDVANGRTPVSGPRTGRTVAVVEGAASQPVRRILFGPRSAVTIHLGRRSPDGSSGLPGVDGRAVLTLLGLAPGGACRAARVTPGAGALLPHRFTLACTGCPAIGGLFSVALSCGSPRLAVNQHPALRSPDLPRHSRTVPRPPGRLTVTTQSTTELVAQMPPERRLCATSSWRGLTPSGRRCPRRRRRCRPP